MQQTPMTEINQLKQENEFLLPPVLVWTKDTTPATFSAEYAIDPVNNDLIYHFYPPLGGIKTMVWKVDFAVALEAVAIAKFGCTAPRLTAAYTEEMNSWWMRARGFADVGDPILRSQAFFQTLDDAFSKEMEKDRLGLR